MENISPEQLSELNHGRQDIILLDVREPWEFEICRISGSINIPMGEITKRSNELDADARTVVICHHGMRSLQVGDYLQSIGFQDIMNLEGGVAAWGERIDKNMPQY